MSNKTKLIVKEEQILADVEWLFDEIREAKGNWKAIEKKLVGLVKAVEE